MPSIAPAPEVAFAPAATPSPSKTTDATTVERSKPIESAPSDRPQIPRAVATPVENAPDFLVSDPAGYSRTLDDYRGYVLLIGILNSNQPDSTANLERIYKSFNSNAKFRFLGVATNRQTKPVNTTFPIAYNRGSKLFGAAPGDFVLLDQAGSIQLRGSLVKDFDNLQNALRQK
jgi:DNA segregation ATPase FtsK/SpoIIIE-like protein